MSESLSERLQRVDALVETLEHTDDAVARTAARELMQTLLTLHRSGLGRMVEIAGEELLSRWLDDEQVRGLLLLHGLHPVPVKERVEQALKSIRSLLAPIEVELRGVEGDLVTLRVASALESLSNRFVEVVERAIGEVAPDIARIEIETAPSERIPLPLVGR